MPIGTTGTIGAFGTCASASRVSRLAGSVQMARARRAGRAPDRPETLLRKPCAGTGARRGRDPHSSQRRPAAILRWRRTADNTGLIADGLAEHRAHLVAYADGLRSVSSICSPTARSGSGPNRLAPRSAEEPARPLIAWSLIDVHDPAIVGDSRLIWELNRHQWPSPSRRRGR